MSKPITERIGYAAPYGFEELLAFYRHRALEGVELVDGASYMRTARLRDDAGDVREGWLRVENDASSNKLVVTLSPSLAPVRAEALERVRFMFDAERDPIEIEAGLATLTNVAPEASLHGVRVPGCFDPFELACRAILGQQVTVKAANKIAARVAAAHGRRIDTGIDGLELAWPDPADVLAIDDVEDALGVLGVIKTRSRVIRELARMIDAGELSFETNEPADERMRRLLAVKGIGPWSANYIAMRTMSHADAFLESDSGVAHALPDLATPKERLAAVEGCRPWRSYAVLALWNSLVE